MSIIDCASEAGRQAGTQKRIFQRNPRDRLSIRSSLLACLLACTQQQQPPIAQSVSQALISLMWWLGLNQIESSYPGTEGGREEGKLCERNGEANEWGSGCWD